MQKHCKAEKIGCAVTYRIERPLQYSKIQQIISDERQAVIEENKVSFVFPCLKLCTYYDILFFSIKCIQLSGLWPSYDFQYWITSPQRHQSTLISYVASIDNSTTKKNVECFQNRSKNVNFELVPTQRERGVCNWKGRLQKVTCRAKTRLKLLFLLHTYT